MNDEDPKPRLGAWTRILGDTHDRTAGSRVDVHLHDGAAYTASYPNLAYQAMAAGALALVAGSVMLWYVRRKYRTR